MKRNFGSRSLVLLLALLMVLSVFAVACRNNNGDGNGTGTQSGGVTTGGDETKAWEDMTMKEQRETVDDELPEKDMDGMTFTIMGGQADPAKYEIGLDYDSSSTDQLEVALYKRNEYIEGRYNVELDQYLVPNLDVNAVLTMATDSGTGTFDFAIGSWTTLPAIAQAGGCYDWADLPYVNLEKPWYNQSALEAVSVDGHTFAVVGEFNLTTLAYSYAMFWNLDLAADWGLEDIYTTVNEGKWTYDYLLQQAKTFYTDNNNDSLKGEEDTFAFAGDPHSAVVTWQYAFDNPIYTQEEGRPVFSLDLEKQHDMVVKLNDLYWDAVGGYTKDWGAGDAAWSNGRVLAHTGMFYNYERYRDITFKFAMVPYPMYDENQTDYYSMSDGAHQGMVVPLYVQNIEDVSIIIELLNAESYKKVTPEYYETVLQNKFIGGDEKAIEMMDKIYSSVVFDFAYAYNSLLNNISFYISSKVRANSDDTQSAYSAAKDANLVKSQDIINTILGIKKD